MQSQLLSTTYAYDSQQVIYMFDKMQETAADKIVIDG